MDVWNRHRGLARTDFHYTCAHAQSISIHRGSCVPTRLRYIRYIGYIAAFLHPGTAVAEKDDASIVCARAAWCAATFSQCATRGRPDRFIAKNRSTVF